MGDKEDKNKGKNLNEMSDEDIQKTLKEAGFQTPFSGLENQIKGMLPKVPSIPDFSPMVKPATRIQTSLERPPKREIKMSDSEEKAVKEALDYFEANSLYEAELIKLFDDWQSSRTKSIKKFLLSILAVLALTVFAGINILEVELFSIKVADGYQLIFLSAFLFVLTGLFFYYEISLRRDKRVNDSDLKVFMSTLIRSTHYLNFIENILEDKRVNIEQLIEDFDEGNLVSVTKKSPLRGYRLMKFFKTDLEKPFKTDLKIYRFEVTGLYALGLLSVLTIIRSMIWVDNPEANLVALYFISFWGIFSFLLFLQLRFEIKKNESKELKRET